MNNRMWAVVIGVGLAIAGTFGVAVGTYSLPDPTNATVGAHVYDRGDQRASAFWSGMFQGADSALRIEVFHTGSVEAGGEAGEHHNVESSFNAILMRCAVESCDWSQGCDGESCEFVQQWNEAVPMESFTFDPAMASAHFAGTVQGCAFDVTWTGEGEIAPVTNHDENTVIGPGPPWHGELDFKGVAELSRVAPATFETCLGLPETQARGFLSQGLTRSLAKADYFEPGE